jgi:hypothetical protein
VLTDRPFKELTISIWRSLSWTTSPTGKKMGTVLFQFHETALPARPREASQFEGLASVIQVQELATFSGWPQPYCFFNRLDTFLTGCAVFQSTSADVCLAQPMLGNGMCSGRPTGSGFWRL